MDFKKLNESLQKFLEGDVISFTDFRRNKIAQRRKERNAEFEKQFGDEINKELENYLLMEINKVDIVWAEGRIDGKNSFEDGQSFSFEEFQKRAFEYNYVNELQDHVDKVKVTVHFTGKEKGKDIDETTNVMLYLGEGDKESDLIYVLQRLLQEYCQTNNLELIIKNDPVDFDKNKLQYAQVIEKPEEKEEVNPLQKDYSNGGTKLGTEVEVGDIVTSTWGYSMTLVDFYKVIDKKKASIKLQHLETKPVEGGQGRGKLVPIDVVKPDKEVDGKLFRIGVKWDNKIVCKVKGHYADYWDGKPKSYDTWD